MRKNEEARRRARELRIFGMSIGEIAKQLSVSAGSVSNWVCDIVLNDEQKRKISNIRQKEGQYVFDLPVSDLEGLIADGLSQKMMAERFGVSPGLMSRVFKAKGLSGRTKRGPILRGDLGGCKVCGKSRKGVWRGRTCPTCVSKLRRVLMKIKAVRFLGGKCQRCEWVPDNKEVVAMEFHHKEAGSKDFEIGKKMNHKWETIVYELEKCELLCSRCHRIEHSSRDVVLDYVLKHGTMAEG